MSESLGNPVELSVTERRELSPERQLLAKKRWQLLLNVLSKNKCRVDSSISVRRFASFGLLATEVVGHDKETHADQNGTIQEKRHIWYKYSSPQFPDFLLEIRHLDGIIEISDILGFNNTGNVCVWPSEEILTRYCLQHRDLFRDKSVCELGGGMTCLAGLAVSLCTQAAEVLLTDGNDNSVKNVEVVIEKNRNSFDLTKVSANVLRWNTLNENLKCCFDIVICADCLFFDEFRDDLVNVVSELLKPEGICIIFAPRRGNTFQEFKGLLQGRFNCVQHEENYDEKIWSLHQQNLEKGTEVYDPNLHYPMLLTFKKPAS